MSATRHAQRPLDSFASIAWLGVTPPSPIPSARSRAGPLSDGCENRAGRISPGDAVASPSCLRASPAGPRGLGWAGGGRPCSGARCAPEPRAAARKGSSCAAGGTGARLFLRRKSSGRGAGPGPGGEGALGPPPSGRAGPRDEFPREPLLPAGRGAGLPGRGRGAAAFPSWAAPGGASGQPSASPPGGRSVRPARLAAGARPERPRFRVAPAALPAEGSSSAQAANCGGRAGRAPLGPLPPPESVRSAKDAAM